MPPPSSRLRPAVIVDDFLEDDDDYSQNTSATLPNPPIFQPPPFGGFVGGPPPPPPPPLPTIIRPPPQIQLPNPYVPFGPIPPPLPPTTKKSSRLDEKRRGRSRHRRNRSRSPYNNHRTRRDRDENRENRSRDRSESRSRSRSRSRSLSTESEFDYQTRSRRYIPSISRSDMRKLTKIGAPKRINPGELNIGPPPRRSRSRSSSTDSEIVDYLPPPPPIPVSSHKPLPKGMIRPGLWDPKLINKDLPPIPKPPTFKRRRSDSSISRSPSVTRSETRRRRRVRIASRSRSRSRSSSQESYDRIRDFSPISRSPSPDRGPVGPLFNNLLHTVGFDTRRPAIVKLDIYWRFKKYTSGLNYHYVFQSCYQTCIASAITNNMLIASRRAFRMPTADDVVSAWKDKSFKLEKSKVEKDLASGGHWEIEAILWNKNGPEKDYIYLETEYSPCLNIWKNYDLLVLTTEIPHHKVSFGHDLYSGNCWAVQRKNVEKNKNSKLTMKSSFVDFNKQNITGLAIDWDHLDASPGGPILNTAGQLVGHCFRTSQPNPDQGQHRDFYSASLLKKFVIDVGGPDVSACFRNDIGAFSPASSYIDDSIFSKQSLSMIVPNFTRDLTYDDEFDCQMFRPGMKSSGMPVPIGTQYPPGSFPVFPTPRIAVTSRAEKIARSRFQDRNRGVRF